MRGHPITTERYFEFRRPRSKKKKEKKKERENSGYAVICGSWRRYRRTHDVRVVDATHDLATYQRRRKGKGRGETRIDPGLPCSSLHGRILQMKGTESRIKDHTPFTRAASSTGGEGKGGRKKKGKEKKLVAACDPLICRLSDNDVGIAKPEQLPTPVDQRKKGEEEKGGRRRPIVILFKKQPSPL